VALTTNTEEAWDENAPRKTINESTISNIIELSRFENLHRLLRVTAYVLRFIKNCRMKRRYNLRKQRLDGEIHSKVGSIGATKI
jgi:hypothetical protein